MIAGVGGLALDSRFAKASAATGFSKDRTQAGKGLSGFWPLLRQREGFLAFAWSSGLTSLPSSAEHPLGGSQASVDVDLAGPAELLTEVVHLPTLQFFCEAGREIGAGAGSTP